MSRDTAKFGIVTPHDGDVIIRPDDQFAQMNAHFFHSSDLAYMTGYRSAARTLVAYLQSTPGPGTREADSLVYPIVHIYRHCVELLLKANICVATLLCRADFSSKEAGAVSSSHDLRKLLEILLSTLANASAQSGVSIIRRHEAAGLKCHISQLSAIDPTSQSFRYPRDKYGSRSIRDGSSTLNIRVFSEHMEILCNYLEAVENYLNEIWSSVVDSQS